MRLFPKTNYAKGIHAVVPISQCMSANGKDICAADEYMQIQVAYRRYLEPTLKDAGLVLLGKERRGAGHAVA